MHGIGQTFSNMFMFIVITVIGIVYGLLYFSETNQQQSASSIVQAALLDASDDNGKVINGTMVIDTDRFEQSIKQSKIDNWRKRSHDKDTSYAIGIYYLDDKSKNTNDFHQLETTKDNNRKVLKGVKVVVMKLSKTTPEPAKAKLTGNKNNHYSQLGVVNQNHEIISLNDLDKLDKNETVYVTQPTDIITYLISNHGTTRVDDSANGLPETNAAKNERDSAKNDYLTGYLANSGKK